MPDDYMTIFKKVHELMCNKLEYEKLYIPANIMKYGQCGEN